MEKAVKNQLQPQKKYSKEKIAIYFKRNWPLYVFLLPAVIYVAVLNYWPMYGIQIAFKNYHPLDGILGSPWVGFDQFITFFESPQFVKLLTNTLVISIYQLIAGFPIPIIFAILLNYTISKKFKKISQMVTYAPHFISMVVYVGMIQIFLQNDGVVNQIIMVFGGEPINFMGTPEFFRHIYVWSGILQNMGFSSIIYISVLTAVSPELHEVATVDGASKFQRILYIDLPHIIPTAIILLILNVGGILSVGFEKAYLMQLPINLEYSEIISTYVYSIGLQGGQFSYSTAIGLFNSVINAIMLLIVNAFARKFSETSLF